MTDEIGIGMCVEVVWINQALLLVSSAPKMVLSVFLPLRDESSTPPNNTQRHADALPTALPRHPDRHVNSVPAEPNTSAEFPQEPIVGRSIFHRTSSPNIEDAIASTDLHSTSDALNLLSRAAEMGTYESPRDRQRMIDNIGKRIDGHEAVDEEDEEEFEVDRPFQYPLISQGLLTIFQVTELLKRYKQYYHPYLPIAPKRAFEPGSLKYMIAQEPHLLTAMITVAARDLPSGEAVLRVCSDYMHQLVSKLSAGKKCGVEAVEALLLLSEWEPQDSLPEIDAKTIGCGEEDRAAWMHVGLALRIGYFLGLDRTSIKYEDEDRANHFNRRRVTWQACYIADRQLSARIGRAFWSRGPMGLMGVGRHGRQSFDEFPSLQPQNPGDTDYASILQANLDLTQLFSNVHDVLYSGMGSSMKLMLAGNYVKYVDDFRSAIVGWKSVWGTLTCPPNIKATLQMSYEYLRLYTNAYAFQATVSRGVAARTQNSTGVVEIPHGGVPSMPDARFIYESVDAAKTLLSIINSYIDAETCLRYLPLRFSLYCVNSAVFLYKAWSFEVLSTQEKLGIRHLISDVILQLQKASVRPNDFTSRYSSLLEKLWQRKDAPVRNDAGPSDPHGFVTTPARSTAPYNIHTDDFSWLDLQAVGELVTGDHPGDEFGLDGYTNGFLSMPGEWSDMGWADGEDASRYF
ncbi:hypothetical protein BP6252_05550 [Coleophoma cylindrospora]|uniref:Xylanolytic transcriptional activator regulatory domain-containing protein n=1 Tax=Coleophoma cylindrospora TaxID=1849047 RepID=A0A3D8RTT3_9HELO|nr:hypothetical protein BP6252_05550 [Coleophoma cylindrospora]